MAGATWPRVAWVSLLRAAGYWLVRFEGLHFCLLGGLGSVSLKLCELLLSGCLAYLPTPLWVFLGNILWHFVIIGDLPAASSHNFGTKVLRADSGCLVESLFHGLRCVGSPGPGLVLGGGVGCGILGNWFTDCPGVVGREGIRFVDV